MKGRVFASTGYLEDQGNPPSLLLRERPRRWFSFEAFAFETSLLLEFLFFSREFWSQRAQGALEEDYLQNLPGS